MSASNPGLGGSGTLTTSESTAYNHAVDGGTFQAVAYTNTDGTNDALIRIPELQGAANYFPIPPGAVQQFVVANGSISAVYSKSSAGTVIIKGGPVASR